MESSFCYEDLRLWQNHEAGRSSHEFSDEDQSQLLWILQTYKALCEQGFYEPHVRVTPKGRVERVAEEDGSYSTLIQMHVNAELCT